jgi:hypothetical protein
MHDDNFILRRNDADDTVERIDGVYTCQSCGEDFREVGFWEAVNVVEYTIYQFDQDSGKFEESQGGSDGIPGTHHIYCQGCEAEVSEYQYQALLEMRG